MTTKLVPIFRPNNRIAWIMAGPTRELPEDRLLIRCAAEIPVDAASVLIDVSVGDFQPFDDEVIRKALPIINKAMDNEVRLYVGCMGGTGRTGTLLAILAGQHPDMAGTDARTYIRQVYKRHAVETKEQFEQVIRLSKPDELKFTYPDWGDGVGGPKMPMPKTARPWWKRLLNIG